MTPARVAIVHEWLENWAGSEHVLEQLIKCYPHADLFAIVDFLPPADREKLAGKRPRTTFIQKLPFARKLFRHYLGLMPLAVEQLDFTGYDIVISSHHAVAKGVITGPDQLHVSYVHSPMRYAWDLQNTYLRQSKLTRGLLSLYVRWLFHRLRNWDVRAASGVDLFVANSRYIARRIRKTWRRHAFVLPPPVDVSRFSPGPKERGDYVMVARLVPYKRADLVIEAFRRMPDKRLLVIGDGPERARIDALAEGAANIELRGHVPSGTLVEALQGARAFVYAGEEDFGISMVEAQACGTPVIAYGRGGACDIVIEGETGILFPDQTAESIIAAIARFEATPTWESALCRANAERFSEEIFRTRFMELVDAQWAEFMSGNSAGKSE
ncbi:glycosyltransferase [Acidomonas methanolica]|uniref:glycosyltransferase n=1 Tax=Acidomonas methanolica TaxID=437 RepID=UPI00211A0645|nr:glycosyltransferase [Acidomonas methanolica]MCQ9156492.1 glycosyltransferase [Acidomonas methanolica]